LHKVGFAAPIGADDPRQPTFNDELAGLDEGFETNQSKFVELHARHPRRAAHSMREPVPHRLQQWIDNRRHLFNRHRSWIFLPVYEESRRCGNAKVGAMSTHPSYFIEKRLVRQACLEGLL